MERAPNCTASIASSRPAGVHRLELAAVDGGDGMGEQTQLSGKESLREAIAADYFQIRAQGAVEGGSEDRSICDSAQYQRSFRLGRAEALNCKSDCSQMGGVDLVPTQVVIGAAIARVRLVDNLVGSLTQFG